MSSHQQRILSYLRKAKEADPECPVAPLPGIHNRTIKAMFEHGWIFLSPGLDGMKYYISERGLQALKVYESPSIRHDDGLCPRCRIRPIHIYSTGRTAGYCRECKTARDRERYDRTRTRVKSELCPRCKERARQKYKDGRKYHAYCKECRHADRARERQKRRERDLERARAGEFLPCRRCKIRPRRVFPTFVEDYCAECSREYHYQYRRRKEFEKAMCQ